MKKSLMTKAQALADFRSEGYEYRLFGDLPALREAWNNFTDALCKLGVITPKQYDTWANPY